MVGEGHVVTYDGERHGAHCQKPEHKKKSEDWLGKDLHDEDNKVDAYFQGC